jgi:HK97 family phage prohead protease
MKNTSMDLKFSFFPALEIIKSDNVDKWIIRGYAATSDLDRQNDVISKEALDNAVENLKQNTTVFYEHKHDEPPVGKIVNAGVDSNGLWIEAFISKTRPDIWQLIQEGILNKFSIGGKLLKSSKKFDTKSKQEYNYVEDIEILEVSIVGLPANPAAEFHVQDKSLSLIGGICKALAGVPSSDIAEERREQIVKKEDEKEISKQEEPMVPVVPAEETPAEETPAEVTAAVEEITVAVETAVEEAVAEVTTDEAVVAAVNEAVATAVEESAPAAVEEAVAAVAEVTEKQDSSMEVTAAIAALSDKLDKILDALSVKPVETAAVEQKAVDMSAIEDVIVKTLDARLGKIRLVPSRKGTIIKTDLDLKEESDDEASNLLDEEKFKKLDKESQKQLINKALTSIFRS